MPDVTHELAAQALLPDSSAGDAAIAESILAVTRATRETSKALVDIGDTLAEVLYHLRAQVEVRARGKLILIDNAWLNPRHVVAVRDDDSGHATVHLVGGGLFTFLNHNTQDVITIFRESVFA